MRSVFLLVFAGLSLQAQNHSLGIGVYPGDPRENFAPAMRVDSTTYRNLALHRPAYQSSSYDYNLTAQLITDGIKETALPRWIVTSSSASGVFPKNEREYLFDGNWVTGVDLTGSNVWVHTGTRGRRRAVRNRSRRSRRQRAGQSRAGGLGDDRLGLR
jgi:hypothetical protein